MSSLKKLNTIALTLLIAGTVDSIRNLPIAALFGSTLIFFFIFAAIIFLIPTALISAELAANIDEGGIYQWCRLAFGEKIGFLAVWMQWINNLVWFPTILSFIAGTGAYLINPALAQDKLYLTSFILLIFWLLTLVNLRGVHLSTKFTSFCTSAGLIMPMTVIIISLVVWFSMGKPLQIHLTTTNIFPSFKQIDNWVALTAIILSCCGMEIATVHIKEVHEPQKAFPKALAFSTILIIFTMMLGSLAIAFIMPHEKINLVDGTLQYLSYVLSAYHLAWLIPVFALSLVIGSIGSVINWVIAPVKGLFQAAQHDFLPPIFKKHNKYGVPQNLLIAQAIIVSIVCMSFLFFPTINASYWLLSILSTQLYMLMYVLMFLCALRLRKKLTYPLNTFVIPGKIPGLWFVCLLGITGCMITFFIGFIPPDNINIGNKFYYEMASCGCMLIMVTPVLFFYRYRSKKQPHLPNLAILSKADFGDGVKEE